jgi:malic enzyme
VFVFPGLGLGAIVAEAPSISDAMVLAAARTLCEEVTADRLAAGALYPPIADLRAVSRAIAVSVGREAIGSGIAPAMDDDALAAAVDAAMWWPDYVAYHPS